jgi:hypothetical protein
LPNKRKVDNEIWFEGVYNGKIGFFPSIFVESQYENEEIDELGFVAAKKDNDIDNQFNYTENLNKIGGKTANFCDEEIINRSRQNCSPECQKVPNS